MTCAELYKWMGDPSLLTKSSLLELRQMVDEYPYFHAVRMLYLKNLAVLQDVSLNKDLKKMSVFVPDRCMLYKLINEYAPNEVKIRDAEHSPREHVRTSKTENAFEVVENSLPAVELDEKDFINTLVSKPISPQLAMTDYTQWLTQQTDDLIPEEVADNRLKHQDLIDSFMSLEGNQLAQRLSGTVAQKEPELSDENEKNDFDPMENSSLDDSYFTETLARVYINQKRFDKALEIIRVLNLKYPKKNLYFADQIRYLEKIINLKK